MRELPILFSAPMVRALLYGRKTQTRRVVKPQPPTGHNFAGFTTHSTHTPDEGKAVWGAGDTRAMLREAHRVRCPYGLPGDRLWVRETWQHYDWSEEGEPCIRFAADNATAWPDIREDYEPLDLVDRWETLSRHENYSIDGAARDRRWRPSIHMPRWASRITLEVSDVRVERLRAISETDARAEGGPPSHPSIDKISRGFGYEDFPRSWFAQLWESINGAGSWDANPWVWAITFQRTGALAPQ